jgi:hypothetical protein
MWGRTMLRGSDGCDRSVEWCMENVRCGIRDMRMRWVSTKEAVLVLHGAVSVLLYRSCR